MNSNQVQQGWERAEDLAPARLADARLQLHYALQIVADAGRKLADGPDTDFVAAGRCLATAVVRAPKQAFRVALGLADFSLLVTDLEGKPSRTFPLGGQTIPQAVAWLRAELDALGADGSKVTGDTPFDLPPHRLADGAAFAPLPPEVWRRLSTYFSNAWRVLTYVSEITPDCAAPPRLSSEVLAYEARVSPAEGVEIALGFRPGDAEHDEPYLYVAITPRPDLGEDDVDDLEELEGGGEWTDEEWFGAVLPASAYTVYDSESVQAACATSFFDSALEQARNLVDLGDE
jgi:hypothetical protein